MRTYLIRNTFSNSENLWNALIQHFESFAQYLPDIPMLRTPTSRFLTGSKKDLSGRIESLPFYSARAPAVHRAGWWKRIQKSFQKKGDAISYLSFSKMARCVQIHAYGIRRRYSGTLQRLRRRAQAFRCS